MLDVEQPASSLSVWSLTDVGKVRGHNEDAFLVDAPLQLYAVADGMGGHAAGEVASKLALDTFVAVVREGSSRVEACRADPASRELRRDVLLLLESAAQA